jgi:geranylgeranyl diphosphate synthase type I
LDSLLDVEQERWAAVDRQLREPLASLRAVVAGGGKRLRPAFCTWGFVAAGGSSDDPAVVDAGAAIELVHTMAIVHDDIMDGSDRRRGVPCLHIDWADRHRRHGWRGEPRRFGDGAAILMGDLAFVYADRLLQAAPDEAQAVFTELRLEVNAGQLLDLLGTASGAATPEQAHTICVYKSGKYTVERPLHLGAALAGGLERLAGPFTAYGIPLGEAFQLRDDLLGAFGDSSRLGKGVGEDVREGKPTALFATAMARAAGPGAELLRLRYGAPDLADDEVDDILAIIDATGARAEVERSVETLVEQAMGALVGVDLGGGAREELVALAAFVAGRDH